MSKEADSLKDVNTGKEYEVRDGNLVEKHETTMSEHIVDLATTIVTLGASELMKGGK